MKQVMRNLLLYAVLVLLTPSCDLHETVKNNSADYRDSTSQCIEPKYDFNYPTNLSDSTPVKSEEVLPTPPWQFKIVLPDLPDKTGSSDLFLISRSINGDTELWVRRTLYPLGEQSSAPSILETFIYRDSWNRWQKIEALQDGISIVSVDHQIDGPVWGIGYSTQFGGYELFKFDEQTKRFQVVENSDPIPPGRIIFDQKNTIWIAKPSDAIYRYNLATMKLSRVVSIADIKQLPFDNGMVLAPDGSIYILVPKRDIQSTQDLELIHFSTLTGEIERNIPIMLAPYPTFSSLFADQSNRIWFSDIGWMSSDKKYYQIVRSPIFIRNNIGQNGNYDYYPWVHSTILLESSNHLLWFRSENGLAWLEPDKGEWCWFTTLSNADLIEDDENNIWLIANGKLYLNKSR